MAFESIEISESAKVSPHADGLFEKVWNRNEASTFGTTSAGDSQKFVEAGVLPSVELSGRGAEGSKEESTADRPDGVREKQADKNEDRREKPSETPQRKRDACDDASGRKNNPGRYDMDAPPGRDLDFACRVRRWLGL